MSYANTPQHQAASSQRAVIFCLLPVLIWCGAALAQSEQTSNFDAAVDGTGNDSPNQNTNDSRDGSDSARIDAYTRSLNELFATSKTIGDQPGGDASVVFDGEYGDPRWLQGLTVTKSDNPMLEQACRRQAVQGVTEQAAHAMHIEGDEMALQQMLAHMDEHTSFIREHDISYADYLRSLAECETYCAPLVSALMQCHILSVARKPHGIVLFELGSSRVNPSYNVGVINEMVTSFEQTADASILLVGRASQIGDLRYNRRLSGERSLAVRDQLIEAGVPLERIRPIWFGWEPPQIDDFIAEEYGLADLYQTYGKDELNQSVVMVLF